jgi:hypothetical protein
VRQFKPAMTNALSMALAVYPEAEVFHRSGWPDAVLITACDSEGRSEAAGHL